MVTYGLDPHGEMLLEEYRQQLPLYTRLQQVVMKKLNEMARQIGIDVNSMEARIKGESSLVGKLERKGYKYQSIRDITDIFGARIITFYNEDVDRMASMAESLFDIDWPNSVDKRKMHQFDSFGYNSLHYICQLPRSVYQDAEFPELNDIRFELQMRTALQHVWSAIQHDIGYKSEIETPMEYHRDLSRLAGMLELADNEFSRIRNSVSDYRRRAQSLLRSGRLEEVLLDRETFYSYIEMKPFNKLNRQIASITQAELHEASFAPYLIVLKQMGLNTLGDVERMIKDCYEDAYQLALFQLGSTDIDILAETIGLQNLCIVHILKAGKGKPGILQLFDTINGKKPQNDFMASTIIEQASRLPFFSGEKS
jgi:ppGpp synthetase/RelA/SpoT-type nucleotidyltranferase